MGNNERNNYVKEAIIRATIGLLKERNLSEISISDITDKADVSRNSFYRNFSDKQAIIVFLLDFCALFGLFGPGTDQTSALS